MRLRALAGEVVMRVDMQPVETTLYSLSDELPSVQPDRRLGGDRLMTLYRVGSMVVGDRRELCLIKNISAGGMMVRVYSPIAKGTAVSIELKSGQPVHGTVGWIKDDQAGIKFNESIDVIDILSATMGGARPRMPRIEAKCFATLREGANTLRVKTCDVSQGGVKVEMETVLPKGTDVVVTLPGLPPQPAVVRWTDGPYTGITFNRLLPLGELVAWLQVQRETQRAG